MSESPIRDFLVGVFVLIGLAAIAYLSIAQRPGARRY